MSESSETRTPRRQFLKTAAATSVLAAGAIQHVHAGEDNTIKVALVGCGGRGTGAALNALGTKGPTKLVAMADVFDQQIQRSLKGIAGRFPKKVDVPKERQFVGFDAFKKAVDCLDDKGVILLATPPAFRPIHLEYAVEKGVNVFMEKSFAVDGPGIRRVLEAGKKASAKNLKIAGGLMSRHSPWLGETVDRIHDGEIGKVITCWAYREHGPVGFSGKRNGESDVSHQIRNYSCFTWLNGSFILDWLIHNLDVCCWVKDAWPVSAQGQGGRQTRTQADQQFDHFAVEYRFADGTRLFAQGRHMAGCWGFFGDIIHGAKGSGVLGEGVGNPKLFKGHLQTKENIIFVPKGPNNNQYQVEHDRLFAAIRENRPYNEAERSAYAALTGILGRMAAESGKEVTWEQALNSTIVVAPKLENLSFEAEAPVKPDADGKYGIAMPGFTKAV